MVPHCKIREGAITGKMLFLQFTLADALFNHAGKRFQPGVGSIKINFTHAFRISDNSDKITKTKS
jgi:hypothetical protein